MLDEWIEQSNLRLRPRVYADPEPLPRRFVTTTGDLIPLTESVLHEIEAIIDAYLRGETPPGYVPQVETASGKLETVTPEAFEVLVERIRAQAPRSTTTNQLLKDLPAAEPDDDIVDAEWVIDLDEPEIVAEPEPESAPEAPPISERQRMIRSGLLTVGALVVVAVFIAVMSLLSQPSPGAVAVPGSTKVFPSLPSPTARSADLNPTFAGTQDVIAAPSVTPLPPPPEQGVLAFASDADGDFDIYVRNMTTERVMAVTTTDSADRSPAWSPDGDRLVYVSDWAGDDDLYWIDADGGSATQITTSTTHDHSPVWSPGGDQVVFARETASGSDLMAFDPVCMDTTPGACEEALTTLTSGSYDREPDFTADGLTLIFASSSFPGLPSAIAQFMLGGRDVTLLEGTGSADSDPGLSPDGEWIAFVSNVLGDDDLWLMHPDGSGLIQLTESPSADIQPEWSPGGELIVFASDRGEGADFDLYLLDVSCLSEGVEACEESVTLLLDGEGDQIDPAWLLP